VRNSCAHAALIYAVAGPRRANLPVITAIAPHDGPLGLARQRLDDAVRALADPVPEQIGGVLRWADPLYTRLRAALCSAKGQQRGAASRSRLPCRVDVLALLLEIDHTVCAWTRAGKGGTIDRLHRLVVAGWRPQDCRLIGFYTSEIGRWVITAEELLAPVVKVDLPQPCPRCGARFAYHPAGTGEQVRVRALRVTDTGCRCQACQAYWPPEQLTWLARLLVED
jgi:hypothetical protein